MSKLPESQGNAPGRRASQPPGKAVIYALLVFNGATLYYIEQFIDEQCVIYGGHLGSLCLYALVIKADNYFFQAGYLIKLGLVRIQETDTLSTFEIRIKTFDKAYS